MIFKPLMRAWVKDWPDQSKVAELPNKIPGTWADQSLPPPGWTGDDAAFGDGDETESETDSIVIDIDE